MGRIVRTLDLGEKAGTYSYTGEIGGFRLGKVQGIGAREVQQDAFGVSAEEQNAARRKGVFLVLADGMGGMLGGEKASTQTIVTALSEFDEWSGATSVAEFLEDTAFRCNEDVKTALGEHAGKGGATLVMAHFRENVLHWLTVGDSRICLFHNGALTTLNREHTYADVLQTMVDAGRITMEEAEVDPMKGALTSYLGIEKLKEIDQNEIPMVLSGQDRILLMSDGVFRSISEEEICMALTLPAPEAAAKIDVLIREKALPKQDNYTAVIYEQLGDVH